MGGFLLGLVGFGWGSTILPLLILLEADPKVAIGAVVTSNTVMCLLGSLRYGNSKLFSWRVAAPTAAAAISAALVGTAFSTLLPGKVVVAVLGLYLTVGGVSLALRPPSFKRSPDGATVALWKFVAGGAIPGFFEGAYGSGGPAGMLTLMMLRVPVKVAIGSWLTASLLSQGAASVVYGVQGIVDPVMTGLLVVGGIPAMILGSHITIKRLADSTIERVAGLAIFLLGSRLIAINVLHF
ncbi:MAG: sulfite exporter TauE/SafE family protein [Nitrososphaerota archaeon]